MRTQHTYESLANGCPAAAFATDFSIYPGARYRQSDKGYTVSVRHYESGTVLTTTAVNRYPDKRYDLTQLLKVAVVSIDEFNGKLFTKDGTPVPKNAMVTTNILVDGGIAVAMDGTADKLAQWGGPTTLRNRTNYVRWTTPGALPYSANPMRASIRNKERHKELIAAFAEHGPVLRAISTLGYDTPTPGAQTLHKEASAMLAGAPAHTLTRLAVSYARSADTDSWATLLGNLSRVYYEEDYFYAK